MKKIGMIFFVALIGLFFSACGRLDEKNGTIFCYNTTIDITLYGNESKTLNAAYQEISEIFYHYAKLSDAFSEYEGMNNIYTINRARDFVLIDVKLKELLVYSLNLKDQTKDYFNPMLGNITKLYKDLIAGKINISEVNENLEKELIAVSNTNIVFDGDKVKIDGLASLDLGGIAKGYALQKVKDYLIANNITCYLISAGGSSVLLGEKPTKVYYNVGLKYVDDVKLKMKDKAIGASSIFEQKIEIGDVIYHHIINPFTGKCSDNYDTIFLIGDNAALIDGYVTSFMSMDLAAIKEICQAESYDVIIYKDGHVIYQSNEGDVYG